MQFKCIVTNWDYTVSLCRKLAEDIREDGFEPHTIVALAKGGWFAGRILSDLLGLKELISLGVEHYSGKSIKTAFEQVKNAGGNPKTAVLQLMYTSEFTPDYFGDYITEDAWMVFPWNFFEDMIDIIKKLMKKERRNIVKKIVTGKKVTWRINE